MSSCCEGLPAVLRFVTCRHVLHIPMCIMTTYSWINFGSEPGSAAVEERLTEIALLMREVFPKYSWEDGHGADGAGGRCLHVRVAGREAPVNFTYRELLTYSRLRQRRLIDRRVYNALKTLFEN